MKHDAVVLASARMQCVASQALRMREGGANGWRGAGRQVPHGRGDRRGRRLHVGGLVQARRGGRVRPRRKPGMARRGRGGRRGAARRRGAAGRQASAARAGRSGGGRRAGVQRRLGRRRRAARRARARAGGAHRARAVRAALSNGRPSPGASAVETCPSCLRPRPRPGGERLMARGVAWACPGAGRPGGAPVPRSSLS